MAGKQGKSRKTNTGSGPGNPRRAALAVLGDVLERRQPLDTAMARHFPGFEGRDRAFARALCATVLRRLGQIDDLLARFLDRPLDALDAAVRQTLRLGAAQVLFLDVPDHAAVAATVPLAGRNRGARGLVNALLRRLTREGKAALADQDPVALNIPGWMLSCWQAQWGAEAARRIALASLSEAPMDITLRDGDPVLWAERLQAEVLPTGSLRRHGGGAAERLPGFEEGAWWVQDMAAALPARLFGDLAGRRVLDLCAAPGGKTLQLAAAGAGVTALDRSAKRLERLGENLQRTGLHADIVCADATRWRPEAPFDAILLDAPCSATGTLRRHPDALHLKTPADMEKLAVLQEKLLDAAAAMLAPGGVLVYCTCSLQAEEGEMQAAAFLKRHDDFRRQPVKPAEAGIPHGAVNAEGDIRCRPDLAPGDGIEGGMDGFFIARLTRVRP